jgi:hypothetical protein
VHKSSLGKNYVHNSLLGKSYAYNSVLEEKIMNITHHQKTLCVKLSLVKKGMRIINCAKRKGCTYKLSFEKKLCA